MTKSDFLDYLHASEFAELFTECAWAAPSSRATFRIEAGDYAFDVREVVQKNGFRIYTSAVDAFPPASIRRTLDAKLRRHSHAYFIIFTLKGEAFHHQWLVPVDAVDKRRIIPVEYADDTHAEMLWEKVQGITFGMDETPTVLDVVARVNTQFIVNASEVTKKFYTGFRKQHDAFVKGMKGMDDKDHRNWYASVMLNRLMFCYFIQKKGFFMDRYFNPDVNYLQNNLAQVVSKKGPNKFFGSFYRGFLKGLFEEGLNSPKRTQKFIDTYGQIPYLNGGMFEAHQLEKQYTEIDVPDKVFVDLFKFFDEWHWHLDDRIERDGRDINPDVLGYIFEQYINDRAQMGAYYTKEDITEYIGRNCILPFLFESVKKADPKPFRSDGEVWRELKASGDRYVFAAVKKGVEKPLPDYIEKGVDTSKPRLHERRARWNEKTDAAFALPTEIWRETVARRQRYAEVRTKIQSGAITDIHDFITFNLDIRAFAEDLIRNTKDHLFVKHFYDALRLVTILDPTCGSGAFLFAALNILEPLYEACLDRMEEPAFAKFFKDELDEIKDKYRSNRQYFIYKNIILRNLYGVDIMHEATEIARLRLFLKMVAVVEADPRQENLGLDPLPDVDFNIRCGNTLVGYASPKHLEKSLKGGDRGLFADEELAKISKKAADVADSCVRFRKEQLAGNSAFYYRKGDLNKMIAELGSQLDLTLAKMDYDIETSTPRGKTEFQEWKKNTQPFHWYSEFYNIIVDRGGFDVIIGNPPYVETAKVKEYSVGDYLTKSCGNLYAHVIERCLTIRCEVGKSGMIIPSASVCTPRMRIMQRLILDKSSSVWISIWDERPGKLFDGVDQQLCIQLFAAGSNCNGVNITSMRHWDTAARGEIFSTVSYGFVSNDQVAADVFPKAMSHLEFSILKKMSCVGVRLESYYQKTERGKVYYRNAGGRYWRLVKSFPSYFKSDLGAKTSSTEKVFSVRQEDVLPLVAALSSSSFYWFWRVYSNCRHMTDREMSIFRLPDFKHDTKVRLELEREAKAYERILLDTKKRTQTKNKRSGLVVQDFYRASNGKDVLDEIDSILARTWGLSEDELDFIINYDIKYRMGDELNGEE